MERVHFDGAYTSYSISDTWHTDSNGEKMFTVRRFGLEPGGMSTGLKTKEEALTVIEKWKNENSQISSSLIHFEGSICSFSIETGWNTNADGSPLFTVRRFNLNPQGMSRGFSKKEEAMNYLNEWRIQD
jgi:hypothetical protein